MFRILVLIVALMFSQMATAGAAEDDKAELLELSRKIPLLLKEQGFEAFSAKFHPDFSNWYMNINLLRDREAFLRDIEAWFKQGNHAISSENKPMYLRVDGDTAYLRDIARETFSDSQGKQSQFAFMAHTVFKRHDGKWLIYSVSFNEISNEQFERAREQVLN